MKSNKTSLPLVSVVISMYNVEDYIKECIESILVQSYNNFEIIIVDDGSTDNSVAIVESFNDSRIRLFCRSHNYIMSLNYALFEAKGEFIAHMDADDVMYKDRLNKQLQYMNLANTDICGSFVLQFGRNTINKILRVPTKDEDIKSGLLFSNQFFHPSIMFRTKSIMKWKTEKTLYDNEFVIAEDYMMYVKLAMEGLRFGNIAEPLVKYRKSETQITCSRALELRYYLCRARTIYYQYVINHFLNNSNDNVINQLISNQQLFIDKKISKTEYLVRIASLYRKISS